MMMMMVVVVLVVSGLVSIVEDFRHPLRECGFAGSGNAADSDYDTLSAAFPQNSKSSERTLMVLALHDRELLGVKSVQDSILHCRVTVSDMELAKGVKNGSRHCE